LLDYVSQLKKQDPKARLQSSGESKGFIRKQKITAMLENDLNKVQNKISTMLEKQTRTKNYTITNDQDETIDQTI